MSDDQPNENESSWIGTIDNEYMPTDAIDRSKCTTRGKLSCHSMYRTSLIIHEISRSLSFAFSSLFYFLFLTWHAPSRNQVPPVHLRSYFSRRISFNLLLVVASPFPKVSPRSAGWEFRTSRTSMGAASFEVSRLPRASTTRLDYTIR